MPVPSIETVSAFLTRVRKRLDEELDEDTNFWSDTELLEYANEGVREVWQTVREAHENWFLRTLRSDLGNVPIRGEAYDTSLLAMQSERDEVPLPGDFFELRLLESIPNADTNFRRASFVQTDLSDPMFRSRILETSDTSLSTANDSMFFYDIEQRASGPYLVFATVPRLDDSIGVILKYVQDAVELTADGTFEDSAFTRQMVDAVISYTVYKAREKEGNQGPLSIAGAEWERKRTVALRVAGPRQTRDPVITQGVWDNEYDW